MSERTTRTLRKLADVSPPNARMMARKNASVSTPFRYLILKVGPKGPTQAIPASYKRRVFYELKDAEQYLRPGHEIFEIDEVHESESSDRSFMLTFRGWHPSWKAIAPNGDIYEVRYEGGYYQLFMNDQSRWPNRHNSMHTMMSIAADCAQAGEVQ